jgi:4-hydroxybenzoate polyprenyltransferase
MQRRTDSGSTRPDGDLPDAGIPIIIDAETTISRAGLLVVAIFAYLKPSPLRILRVVAWLLRGRAHIECKLAEADVIPNVALPLDPRLTTLADRAAAEGRAVYLAVAQPSPLLEMALSRFPSIVGVIVEESAAGRAAGLASAALRARFAGGYDAVVGKHGGAEMTRHAASGALAGAQPSAVSIMEAYPPGSVLRELASSVRLHQCLKNCIVFVPLVLGGRLTDLAQLVDTLIAFIALSCVASGTYLVNDIWDIADDRKHWSKRDRSIASGRLSPATALIAAVAIIPLGVLLGTLVSWKTGAMLVLYLAVTLCYTLRLKAVAFVDGLVLATLFTIRLGIGAVAAEVPPSPWLFVFSMFLFSSLSYAKRHTEITRTIVRQDKEVNGRGYHLGDAPMVLTVGLSTGIGAVVIMVLYIVEEAFRISFYGSTAWLWGFPPLIFLFVVRIWLVSARGDMHDDPVAFAMTDRVCIALLGCLLVCFGFAWLG